MVNVQQNLFSLAAKEAGTSEMERATRCTRAFDLQSTPQRSSGTCHQGASFRPMIHIRLIKTYLKLATYRGLQVKKKKTFFEQGYNKAVRAY